MLKLKVNLIKFPDMKEIMIIPKFMTYFINTFVFPSIVFQRGPNTC